MASHNQPSSTPPGRLRIGIDFDGTLADTINAAAAFLRDVEGIALEPHEMHWPPGRDRISGERFVEMITDQRFFDRLEFVPGAEAVTRRLLQDASVFLVTARNETQTTPVRRWLESRDLHFDVIVATSYESKVKSCRELRLDVHFDDMLGHTADVMRETDTILGLLAAPWNDLVPSGDEVVDGEHHVHADWGAFHEWTRRAFAKRLGPS